MGSHGHPKEHTIASHSDTTATGAELEELTDGSETELHSHAGNGVADPHGAAQHTDVTRELYLPSNGGYATSGTPLTHNYYDVVIGDANLDEPKVAFGMKVPSDFVSFTKVEAVWVSYATSGNMYWQFFATYAAESEASDTHYEPGALGVTATAGRYRINVQEPADPLLLTNLAAGDFLGIAFEREGTNALDTLNEAVKLFGILFTYVAEQ